MIYWDNFAGRPTESKDENAPPERYTDVIVEPADIFIEHWLVVLEGKEARCSVAYSALQNEQGDINLLRYRIFGNATPVRMLYWAVPEEHFNKMLRRIKNENH